MNNIIIVHIVDAFITIASSFLCAKVIHGKAKDFVFPMAFAFIIFHHTTSPLVLHGRILSFVAIILSSVCKGVLLEGLLRIRTRSNPVLKCLFLFLTYFSLTDLLSDDFIVAFLSKFSLVRAIFVGVCVGYWATYTPNAWRRLFFAIGITLFIYAIAYYRLGGTDTTALQMGETGRTVIEGAEEGDAGFMNVNAIALNVTASIVYLVVLVKGDWRRRAQLVIKAFAIVALGILSILLVKTGSRNGAVGLGVSLLYFVFATSNASTAKRWVFMIITVGLFAFGFVRMFSNVKLRVFDFSDRNMQAVSKFESISTGRLGVLQNHMQGFNEFNYLFGGGAPIMTSRAQVANCHSIYFQLFRNSGIIGCLLLLFFFFSVVKNARLRNPEHQVALTFIALWFATGIGEGANLTSGSLACYGFGVGIALLAKIKPIPLFDNFGQRRGGLKYV